MGQFVVERWLCDTEVVSAFLYYQGEDAKKNLRGQTLHCVCFGADLHRTRGTKTYSRYSEERGGRYLLELEASKQIIRS
jgi:hypothetical protein